MDFINSAIQEYCQQHSSNEPEVLKELNRFTHAKVLQPRMLSGHLQGRFLAMISKMLKPERILEIGTYTGYSAICLAEGLSDTGKLITIDVNPELEEQVRSFIDKAGYTNKIQFIVGDAYQVIRSLPPNNFDLVFIDADKENYLNYYQLIVDSVNPGGLILADNVLWSGKVIDPNAKDKDTIAIRAFNEFVSNDTRVESFLLPLRDGIMMLRKR